MLFVGINPSLRSAALGHHFAGHGNRFWKLLFESGLVAEPLGFEDDRRLAELGFGLTNIVARATRSCSELSPADYARGRSILRRKIMASEPRIAAFVGVMVYREFFRASTSVGCGLTDDLIGRSRVFVLPNPSGRNAHFSFAEMLEQYRALSRLV
jgi:TDG/mug DNA glycosylase family protein